MRPQHSALRALAGVGSIALTVAAPCSTFSVSNTNSSGPGSLRQALSDANITPGPDVVQIAVQGVIPLGGTALVVSESVAIQGPGANLLAIDAAGLSRVMNVVAGHAELSGLTLRNGRAGVIQSGGGVFVNGELTLRECALINNEVPLNFGFNADGGAVFVASGRAFRADRCLFAENRVGLGTGGAVRGASSSALEFRNCTFSGNSATQGGALATGGSVSLDFCTLAHNASQSGGGAVWAASGAFRVSNSLVARNGAPVGPDWFGLAQSAGFNLIGNPANSSGWTVSDLGGLDPKLGPLDLHGGTTASYALLEESPALDSADAVTFPLIDQRGVSRPQGSAPDRGSFEAEPFNAAPIADAGPDQILELRGTQLEASLDGSGSSDPDGDELEFEWRVDGRPIAHGRQVRALFGKGRHVVTLTVTDPSGASDSDEASLLVTDTTPPEILDLSVSPSLLWPPNHKLWPVHLAYRVLDAADPNPVVWVTCTSSQPDTGLAPDDPPGDIEVLSPLGLKLRAERYEGARTYTVTVRARDADGNEASREISVTVPKSMGR